MLLFKKEIKEHYQENLGGYFLLITVDLGHVRNNCTVAYKPNTQIHVVPIICKISKFYEVIYRLCYSGEK